MNKGRYANEVLPLHHYTSRCRLLLVSVPNWKWRSLCIFFTGRRWMERDCWWCVDENNRNSWNDGWRDVFVDRKDAEWNDFDGERERAIYHLENAVDCWLLFVCISDCMCFGIFQNIKSWLVEVMVRLDGYSNVSILQNRCDSWYYLVFSIIYMLVLMLNACNQLTFIAETYHLKNFGFLKFEYYCAAVFHLSFMAVRQQEPMSPSLKHYPQNFE